MAECVICGKPFVPYRPHQNVCGPICRRKKMSRISSDSQKRRRAAMTTEDRRETYQRRWERTKSEKYLIAAHRQRSNLWRRRNKEKVRKYSAEYKAKHPDRLRLSKVKSNAKNKAKQKLWRIENADHVRLYRRQKYWENHDKIRPRQNKWMQKRRRKLAGAGVKRELAAIQEKLEKKVEKL